MFDVTVIGKGMIGSAAARYLSMMGQNVALIGPDEPADFKTHNGVFSSHYDQGRITRVVDPKMIWGRLAQMAQNAYSKIEAQSGIRFHHAVGGVRAAAVPIESIDKAREVATHWGADFCEMTRGEMQKAMPFFRFPEGSKILLERGMAGYVNPRQFVAAEVACAEQNGATIVREEVIRLEKSANQIKLHTASGTIFESQQVLLATGSFTNKLLPDRPLALKREAEMVLLAEIGPEEQKRLADMPTLIYKLPEESAMYSLYMLPPIEYPDGRTYIKLGGNTHWESEIFEDWDRITEWFHSDGVP
ncbi:MAG: FAD-dependent oxidoreductase, partial [Chloroflexota bacterium]